MALHLLDLIDAGSTSPEDAAEALRYVESYLARRVICQTPTAGINRIFMEAPKDLETDRPAAEAVRRFLSGKRRRWPSDEELRTAIRSKPFYWGGRSPQRSYILRRLEESYSPTEPVDLRPSFPLAVFAEHSEAICEALDWFIHTAALDLARRA